MTEVSTRPSAGATKHNTPPSVTASPQHVGGFSQYQFELAFNAIAAQAQVLRDFLTRSMDRMGREDVPGETATDLRTAVQLTVLIGSTADHMSGCKHLGSVADWTCAGDMWPEGNA